MDGSSRLPDASYYMALWGLEERYGGMTTAVLARLDAFRSVAGVEADLLTYHYDEALDDVRTALIERGALSASTRVRNLWEEVRGLTDEQLRAAIGFEGFTESADGFAPLPRDASGPERLRVIQRDETGQAVQQDHYREDGTLVLSRVDREFDDGVVRMFLCDTSGRPIGYWNRVRALYRLWLDTLPREPRAVIIVDSKTSARHYPAYRRDDVAVIHMVHGSHLVSVKSDLADVSPERRDAFENIDRYDALVFLTERQRADVAAHFPTTTPLHVCPNTVRADPVEGVTRRENRGIAVGRLLKHKRFGSAIEAVALATTWRSRPGLDIVGDGERREVLEQVVRRLNLDKRVRFVGHVTDTARWFAGASFMLLTSKREGFGLVIVEAMAQGCVPIAYDIRYGPSDIITDGVDGFLVPEGSKRLLGRAVKQFLALPARRREAMRDAARRRARDYDAASHVATWSAIIESVWQSKERRAS